MAKKKKVKRITISLGDRYTVNDVMCKVRFVNAGMGVLCPVIDDPEDTLVSRHIAYGKVYSTGKVVKL